MENDKFNECLRKYREDKNINIYKYFNEKKLYILSKLDIIVEDRLYTEYEYDILEEILLEYYTDPNDKELKPLRKLSDKEVSEEEYQEILDIFSKISDDYNLSTIEI